MFYGGVLWRVVVFNVGVLWCFLLECCGVVVLWSVVVFNGEVLWCCGVLWCFML